MSLEWFYAKKRKVESLLWGKGQKKKGRPSLKSGFITLAE